MNRSGWSIRPAFKRPIAAGRLKDVVGQPDLAGLAVNARVAADILDQCEHAATVIVALHHDARIVVLDWRVPSRIAPVPARQHGRQTPHIADPSPYSTTSAAE